MSLEEEMLAWLHEARKTGGAQGAEKQVHRFLQLARREGYVVCMKRNEGTLRLATTSDAEWEAYEDTIPRRQFPIRRTVERRRVVELPSSRIWVTVRHGYVHYHRSEDEARGEEWGKLAIYCLHTEDVAVVAELALRPTETAEVEE